MIDKHVIAGICCLAVLIIVILRQELLQRRLKRESTARKIDRLCKTIILAHKVGQFYTAIFLPPKQVALLKKALRKKGMQIYMSDERTLLVGTGRWIIEVHIHSDCEGIKK